MINMNSKSRVFAVVLSAAASIISQAAPITSVISTSGTTEIAAKSNNGSARVVFFTRPATAGAFENCFVKRESDIPPLLILRDLSIYVDGHPLFVPRSAFNDLESPRGATLHSTGHAFFLEIFGGDGSESYSARIYFDKQNVFRKKVFNTILVGGPVSDTRYFDRSL
jgi:hypothetical protein